MGNISTVNVYKKNCNNFFVIGLSFILNFLKHLWEETLYSHVFIRDKQDEIWILLTICKWIYIEIQILAQFLYLLNTAVGIFLCFTKIGTKRQ